MDNPRRDPPAPGSPALAAAPGRGSPGGHSSCRVLKRYSEETAWQQVSVLIDAKKPGEYDKAVTVLADLRALSQREGRARAFAERFQLLREQHLRKPSLIERFQKAGLTPCYHTAGKWSAGTRRVRGGQPELWLAEWRGHEATDLVCEVRDSCSAEQLGEVLWREAWLTCVACLLTYDLQDGGRAQIKLI